MSLQSFIEEKIASAAELAAAEVIIGEHRLSEQSSPPRIVFVRGDVSYTSGNEIKEPTKQVFGSKIHVVLAHCWGVDEDAAELLSDALETAVRREIGGPTNYVLRSGTWTSPKWMHSGAVLTIDMQLKLPRTSVNTSKAYATISGVDFTKTDEATHIDDTDTDRVLTAPRT